MKNSNMCELCGNEAEDCICDQYEDDIDFYEDDIDEENSEEIPF